MNFRPKTMSFADACRHIGVGKTTMYRLIKDKKIKSFKLGTKTMFLTDELDALVESLAAEQAA